MDYRQTKAAEFVWHSDPRLTKTEGAKVFCRLLEQGSKLAAEKGASTLHISTNPLFPSVGRLLKRRGFIHAETHYSKRM
jgi:hypothetical protein